MSAATKVSDGVKRAARVVKNAKALAELGALKLNFGKHDGRTLTEVWADGPAGQQYLAWAVHERVDLYTDIPDFKAKVSAFLALQDPEVVRLARERVERRLPEERAQVNRDGLSPVFLDVLRVLFCGIPDGKPVTLDAAARHKLSASLFSYIKSNGLMSEPEFEAGYKSVMAEHHKKLAQKFVSQAKKAK